MRFQQHGLEGLLSCSNLGLRILDRSRIRRGVQTMVFSSQSVAKVQGNNRSYLALDTHVSQRVQIVGTTSGACGYVQYNTENLPFTSQSSADH
jgi:hypothetical protein